MKRYEAYATLFTLSIIFTIIDIVVSSCQLPIPSLIFSSITMVIGFIGAHKSKTLDIEYKYDKSVEFIKKNFGGANIILSILDVVCCIIGLMTGIFALLLIFRCTIAIRIAVYINKYRSVAFAIWGVAFMHIFKKLKGERKMTKFTALQKILVTISAIFGVTGVVVFFMPEFMPIAEEVSKYVAMASEVIATILGIWIFGTHDKVLTQEEIVAEEQKVAQKQAKITEKKVNKQVKIEQKQALKQAKIEYKKKQEEDIKALAQEKIKEQQNVSIAKEV